MLNALQISQKLYLIDLSNEQSRKLNIPEVLAFSVSEFYQSIAVQLYQPMLTGWLSLLYVRKWTTVVVIRESLSLVCVAIKADFVAHLCQPSRNVFENKMTSFQ